MKTGATLAAGAALAGNLPLNAWAGTPPRALVFIMLDGGNDSFNMLVPRSGADHRVYARTRANLALDRSVLLPLSGYRDAEGREFGLHPAMADVQHLFQKQQLSFVANVGPMVRHLTRDEFYTGQVPLPLGLLSHADQFRHWLTARPLERTQRGWFGRLADHHHPRLKAGAIPMNISLAGNNILQRGQRAVPYSITDNGSVGLAFRADASPLNRNLARALEMDASQEADPFKSTYVSLIEKAQRRHRTFSKAVSRIRVPTPFDNTPLAQQLKMAARAIQAGPDLGHGVQTFFIRYIGWDHHDELLNNHQRMLSVVSRALGQFQRALDAMGTRSDVVTFTGSDFGRTLTSNGNGTDHGWGGHILVMGDAIRGGRIAGRYPHLELGAGNPLDAGDGVIIPTTPTDHVFAELAQWAGMPREDLGNLFPGLAQLGASDLNLI